jgi:RNA polymerase sigma-70 factor (ECF subfamily)
MTKPGSRRLEQIRSAVATHQSRLISFAARITGDTDSAREVVQETFLGLCKQDLEAMGDHLAAWLFRVCRNKALDFRRKEAPLKPLDEAVASPTKPDLDPHQALERHDEARRVLAAVACLPAPQQEVLRLRFQNDLSYKEISEITGHSISNVGFLLHVAIKRLRGRLQETSGGGRTGVRSDD